MTLTALITFLAANTFPTAFDFDTVAEACDFVTRHDVCVINSTATDYTKTEFEIVTAITLVEAGARMDLLSGMVVVFVDDIGMRNVIGVYMHDLNLIKVIPTSQCLGQTSLAHELTHAIEYRSKNPKISLEHDDPFYWAGYHYNKIDEPWGVAIKAARIATDLVCR